MLTIKEQAKVVYTLWQMSCPGPRSYRWVKNYLSNLDTK